MTAQAPLWIVPDADIDAIQIDGRVGDQPVLAGIRFANQHFLGSELPNLGRTKLVGSGIEIFDLLADAQLRANGDEPFGIGQYAINCRAQTIELEAGGLVHGIEQRREFHV